MAIETELRDEEVETLQELRARIKGDVDEEFYDDDHLLLRFLKVQNYDVNNAEAMLRKNIAWREAKDVKNILQFKKPEVAEKYLTYVVLGYDKEGCPIRYCPVGSTDFLGLLSSVTPEDIRKIIIYEMEADVLGIKKQSEKLQKNVEKGVYIFNFENLSFASITDKRVLSNLIYLVGVYTSNYPERLKVAYALNVSMYFNMVYSALKPIIPSILLDKLRIYHDDSYKEHLLKTIDEDVLPAFLGGNKTDPDGNPLCVTFIKPPEKVPETYYLRNSKRSLADEPDVQKLSLSNAAFHEVTVDVKQKGSFLEWEFETKSRDIGFGLFYNEMVDGEEKIVELIPIQRIDTEEYPETGTFRLECAGTYVIVFDNTYSWLRTKEIYYRAKVVTPEESKMKIQQ